MTVYADASVLLRLAFDQPRALREWREIAHAVSSVLLRVECMRVLDRARLHARLSAVEGARRRDAVARLLRPIELFEVDSLILERASQPMPMALRTLDAIHLATALLWKEQTGGELVMATHDAALATAARAYGLPTVGT